MALYNELGYFDFPRLKAMGFAFNLVVGGRGTGKTFGGLEDLLLSGDKFYFLRRTDTQLKLLTKPDLDPTIDINLKHNTAFRLRTVPKIGMGIYNSTTDEDGKEILDKEPIAYCNALTTAANLRGAGGGVLFDYLILDEFIRLPYERPFKGEDTAFFDTYETINRNRELPPPLGTNSKPLQAFLFSNSNRIDNPILASFGLINQAAKMQAKAKETGKDQIYTNREKNICFIYMAESKVSAAKKNTALYKALGEDNEYTGMAVGNEFADDTMTDIKSMPIREYRPLVSVGEVTIYIHKAGKHYYVSNHKMQSPTVYGKGSEEFKKFNKRWRKLYMAYLSDAVYFESYGAKVAFLHYFSY